MHDASTDTRAPGAPTHLALLPAAWVRKRSGPAASTDTAILRALGYSRYSDDGQSETSIERQEEDNALYIQRRGWRQVGALADRAQSGAHTVDREGLLAVLDAAENGAFDVLVTEDIDRLGRDLGILGTVHRKLTDAGILIHTTRQGRELDPSDVAVRGLQAQETRTLLGFRTSRGREKAARNGRADVVWFGFARSGIPGKRKRVAAHCRIVEEIFRMRVDGLTVAVIRDVLNARGIPSPKGREWSASTIAKIIANPRYRGIQVTRRTRCHTPFNRRRIVKPRPSSEWIDAGVPAWRVVSDEIWDLAQTSSAVAAEPDEVVEGAGEGGEKPRKRAPRVKLLLTGLVRCPGCGGNMMIAKRHRRESRFLTCSGNVRNKICGSRLHYGLDVVEREVLDLVRAQLADPALEREYALAFEEERDRAAWQVQEERDRLTRRLSELRRAMEGSFMDALTEGFAGQDVVNMRRMWHDEAVAAEGRLAGLRQPARFGVPAPERLSSLRKAFEVVLGKPPFIPVDACGHRLVATFQDLVKTVTIQPDGVGRGYRIAVETKLPAVLRGGVGGDPVPTLVIRGRWMSGRTRTLIPASERVRLTEVADSGALDMDDGTWALVGPLVADAVALRRGRPPLGNPRLAVDCLIFLLRTGFPLQYPPPRYGDRATLRSAHERLLVSGAWATMVATLRERAPGFLEGIDLDEAERIRLLKLERMRRREA